MTRSYEGDLTSKASGLQGLPGPIPSMTRSCGRDLRSKADQDLRDHLDLLASTPKPESVCLNILCLSPTLLTLTGGYHRPPFSRKNQLRALVDKSPRHERSISIQTPCQHSSLLGRFIQTPARLLSQCLLPNSHIPYPLCSWECIQLGCRKKQVVALALATLD